MKLFVILNQSNLINAIRFNEDGKSMDDALMIKIMNRRIKLSKIRNEFEEDNQKFIEGIKPDGYAELAQKSQDPSKKLTEEEEKIYKEQTDKLNTSYNTYVNGKLNDEHDIEDFKLTNDEYNSLIILHKKSVTIQNQEIPSGDFLSMIYENFVSE